MRAGFATLPLSLLCLTTVAAQAQDGFSISTSAMSGGFLTQRGDYGFSHGVDPYSVTISQQGALAGFDYRLSLGFNNDADELVLDGSYIERDFNNWTVGFGAIDRNWGPSKYSSLILSDNARPMTSLYLSRNAVQSASPWLSWLGPWYADLVVGQLKEHNNPSNPKFLGMRLGVEPIDGLVLEAVRTAQFGGDGRDNSIESFLKLLAFGNDGLQVNQLGGLSVSYALPDHIAPLRVYMQAIGEDEAGGVPSCYFYMAGAELTTNIAGIPSVLTLEGIDTRVDQTSGGFCGAGTAYNNFQITSGYRHYGESMGAAIDSESISVTLYGEHDFGDVDVSWSIGAYDINTADINNPLTATNEDGFLATLGVTKSWGATSLTGVVAYQSFDLITASSGTSVGVKLDHSF